MSFPELILASGSPRRRDLLLLTGQVFSVRPAQVNETICLAEDPQANVRRLAREKAEAVGNTLKGKSTLALAADTEVVLDGKIFGKPADSREAKRMLVELQGRRHMVYTGICLLRTSDGARLDDLASTEVPMRNYSDEEMDVYIASGDPLDKAGAYAIQHAGFHPVQEMTGCFANIVGMPLCHLQRTLQKWDLHFDVDLPDACQKYLAYECPVSKKILNWEL